MGSDANRLPTVFFVFTGNMAALRYNETLEQLGLMRLERQRMRSDLTETFKIMNGHYNINRDHDRRGHGQKLFKRRFRLDIKKYALCNKVIDNWNS